MGIVEENIKNILRDIKNSRFESEIPKSELIMIINKYTQSPYGYFNRLWIDCYIEQVSEKVFKIISLEFKPNTNDPNKIKEDYEEG